MKTDLRVLNFPQVPCEPFIVEVRNLEQAELVYNTLANQHLWLYENNFIGDYSNSIVVQMFEDGEWVDFYDSEGRDFDEYCEYIKS